MSGYSHSAGYSAKENGFAVGDAGEEIPVIDEQGRLARVFVSAEQTGNGSAQSIPHGLGVVPSGVLIVPTDTAPTTAGDYTAVEGTHTSTNVVVTVTNGKKYKVFAFV